MGRPFLRSFNQTESGHLFAPAREAHDSSGSIATGTVCLAASLDVSPRLWGSKVVLTPDSVAPVATVGMAVLASRVGCALNCCRCVRAEPC